MGFMNSLRNLMGVTEEEPEMNGAEEVDETPVKPIPQMSMREVREEERRSRVTSFPSSDNKSKVVLVKPDRFEDVEAIADHLNNKKTVVLNLEDANREVSRRIIDFLSGVAYANHGNIRKVANSTFIIVARDVDIMGELMLDDFSESKLYF